MRLSSINDSETFLVYKWMSGSDWHVKTSEGIKTIGDMIIPKWVGMSIEDMPMFFSLVYNNADHKDDAYLAVIKCVYDSNAITDKEYTTFEYDGSNYHTPGKPAYKLGKEESLILAPCQLIDLFKVTIDEEDYTDILLTNNNGSSFNMTI